VDLPGAGASAAATTGATELGAGELAGALVLPEPDPETMMSKHVLH
jgi:hypothetical protein